MRPLPLVFVALFLFSPILSWSQGLDSALTRERLGSLVAYVDGRKDGGVATIAWLVFPGAGLMYADKTGQGLLFLAADIGLLSLYVDSNDRFRKALLGGMIASRILEIIVTLDAVHEYNRNLKSQFGLASLHGSTEVKLTISYPL